MTYFPNPIGQPATITGRACQVARRVRPIEAGAFAYFVVAMIAGAWTAVLAMLGALIVAEVWHHHRKADPSQHRLRGMVELVIGTVILLRDGIVRPILWALIAAAVAAVLAIVAFGVIVTAVHGAAVIIGLVAAVGTRAIATTR
ncbi:MAG: hypothetical protein M1115_06055 [Actinobacteria bacterium]|nr:hypothetical protein [Actinomycetota bacterium]